MADEEIINPPESFMGTSFEEEVVKSNNTPKASTIKNDIIIIGIFILILSVLFGTIIYGNYQIKQEVNSLKSELDNVLNNVISKKIVSTICIDKNCTISVLAVNTTNIY